MGIIIRLMERKEKMKAEVQRRVKETHVKDKERRSSLRTHSLNDRTDQRKTHLSLKTEWMRLDQSRRSHCDRNRKELVIRVEGCPKCDQVSGRTIDIHGRRRKSRGDRKRDRQLKLDNMDVGHGKPSNKNKVVEWKQQVARVGTGFRVRRDEKNPRKRRFDVGFSDMKEFIRKDGVEVDIDQSSTGRTVRANGEDARVKVMNTVSLMEKRRPVSPYTGSGIRRKELVGKLKLKSTKPQGKA